MKLKVADVPASIRELDQTRSNFQRPIVARFALTVAGRFKKSNAFVWSGLDVLAIFSGLAWLRAQTYGKRW